MQADAYVNLIDASRSADVSAELVLPMQSLMKRGVAAGQANADLSSLVALLRLSKQGAEAGKTSTKSPPTMRLAGPDR
ncbi:hypothetical protein [Mesorhizobium caraganae]|uniref:hypothetical protein n=1 Tax=Mesorhizobium caraganae TaxID=483206 RepID=UPI001783738E|nr:hypothetical protein [Mesorhizobium caraganae]